MEFAAEELRSDRDLVLEAVRSDAWALEFAAEPLRRDRSLVLEAVHCNVGALQLAAEELRRDRGLVGEAVHRSGAALRFAAEELRRDRDLVLVAVRSKGGALRFAAEELRRDRDVVLEAVRCEGSALRFAAPELHDDPALQPRCAQRNRLAGPGARAPVVSVDSLVWMRDKRQIQVNLVYGFGGEGKSFLMGGADTVGDLAALVVQQYDGRAALVYLRTPSGDVVKPSAALTPLADFV